MQIHNPYTQILFSVNMWALISTVKFYFPQNISIEKILFPSDPLVFPAKGALRGSGF